MSAKSDAALRSQANTIRLETTPKANSAQRVGQMFLDLVDSKINPQDEEGPIVRWSFTANGGEFPTNPKLIYIITDDSVVMSGTQMYAVSDTLPETPTVADFYFK